MAGKTALVAGVMMMTWAALPSGVAQACSLLGQVAGCKTVTVPSVAPSCTPLQRLAGCKVSQTSTQSGSTTTTCTVWQALQGCKPGTTTGSTPPPPATDGSLAVGTANGGLTPLPDHPRFSDSPPPLHDRGAGKPALGFSGSDPSLTSQQLASLSSAAGATVVRVPLSWPGVEYRVGQFGFDRVDVVYRELVAKGIRPLFMLYNTPKEYIERTHVTSANCGGSPLLPGRSCMVAPRLDALNKLSEMARRTAVRYPLQAGIELWNEPNLKRYWRPTPDFERYAQMLRAVDEGVNLPAGPNGSGGRPAVRVFGGSLNNVPFNSDLGLKDSYYLQGVLDNGGGSYMDGISVHPYPFSMDRVASWLPTFQRLEEVLSARPEPWVRSMRIVASEFGVTTGDGSRSSSRFTLSEQATAIESYVGELDAPPADLPVAERVDLLAIHTLSDHAADGSNGGFGVLTKPASDGKYVAKPSFCTLRRLASVATQVPTTIRVPAELTTACTAGP